MIRGRATEIEQVTGANADPVTCTVAVRHDGAFGAFDCDPYVGGTSGAPWLARRTQGSVVAGVIGGLHDGGCGPATSFSPPLGVAAQRTYRRAVAGAAGDDVPPPGDDGC